MPIIESSDLEKEKRHKPRLFQKIITIFVGIPALVTSLGYAEYRHQYKDAIDRGVNISELFKRLYETQDIKESILDTVSDSDYDDTTKSWLINVANKYKDAFEESGHQGVSELIEKGLAPSPVFISEIVKTSDDNQRIETILAEDHREKGIEALLQSFDSTEFKDELARLLATHKEKLTFTEAVSQVRELNGLPPVRQYSGIEDFGVILDEIPLSFRDQLKKVLYLASNTIITSDNTRITFGEVEQKVIIEAVRKYFEDEGADSTAFLLNILENQGAGRYLLSDRIGVTFSNVSWLFDLLQSKDTVSLQFFLNKGSVPSEYTGQYLSVILQLVNYSKRIEQSNEMHNYFVENLNEYSQLGTISFVNFVISAYGADNPRFPTDLVKQGSYIRDYLHAPLIQKYQLSPAEILLLWEINGHNNMWSEDEIKEIIDNPNILKVTKEHFYPTEDRSKIQLAYSEQVSALPAHMTLALKESVFFLLKKYIDRSFSLFSADLLEKFLKTEVMEIGEFDLFTVKNDFSLTTSNRTDELSTSVDIPIILYGENDGFLSFDTKSQKVSENLLALAPQELITALSTFHFIYIVDGLEKFGSIADLLPTSTEIGNVKDVITALRAQNISALTRVLPVEWKDEMPLMKDHSLRINGESFAGILVITEEDGSVLKQYLMIVPSYRLSEMNKSLIAKELNIDTDKKIELLLPDAGYAAQYTSEGAAELITRGSKIDDEQGIRFFVNVSQ